MSQSRKRVRSKERSENRESSPAATKADSRAASSTRPTKGRGSSKSKAADDSVDEADIVKIMITTDNHLGYCERDARRCDDSFMAMEECLQGAVANDVDFILLGGDLFHDNKPSLGTLTRTMALFRKYTLGDKPLEFDMVSDPATNFPTHPLPIANFQDPNVNVAYPVFTIHGNHDDPVGGTSAIDPLSTAGLVNYFGHVQSLEEIVLRPILLRKGRTKIALYGMGNVRDERLHRCFKLQKVKVVKPVEDQHSWFNILLVHQNRGVKGGFGSKAGVEDEMLRGFGFDLIVWGNEHEQLVGPQNVAGEGGFDITQPGSTIMTSLSGNECNPKKYCILQVKKQDYKLAGVPLKHVRPVVRRQVELRSERAVNKTLDSVEEYLRAVMDEMLDEAEEQIKRIPNTALKIHPNLKYPLVRLAVDFTDHREGQVSSNYPEPNPNRFGQNYTEIVVNASDVLKSVKPKHAPAKRKTGATDGDNTEAEVPTGPLVSTSDIREKVAHVLSCNTKDACLMLSEHELTDAVYTFVEKGERLAIDDRVKHLLEDCQRTVWKKVRDDPNAVMDARISEMAAEHKQEVNKLFAAKQSDGAGDAAEEANAAQELEKRRLELQQRDAALPDSAAQGDDVVVVDDDGDGVAQKAKPQPKKAGGKRGVTKAKKNDNDDSTSAPRTRVKKEPTPAPQLQLATGPATSGGVKNIMGKWGKN